MISNFHGEKAFATYMRFLDAGPAERTRILTHEIPRNLGHAFIQDGVYQVKPVHELLIGRIYRGYHPDSDRDVQHHHAGCRTPESDEELHPDYSP